MRCMRRTPSAARCCSASATSAVRDTAPTVRRRQPRGGRASRANRRTRRRSVPMIVSPSSARISEPGACASERRDSLGVVGARRLGGGLAPEREHGRDVVGGRGPERDHPKKSTLGADDLPRLAPGCARLLRRARGRQLEDVLARAQADVRRLREGTVPCALRRDRARVRAAARVPAQPRHPLREGQEPVQDRGGRGDRERRRRRVLRADLERGALSSARATTTSRPISSSATGPRSPTRSPGRSSRPPSPGCARTATRSRLARSLQRAPRGFPPTIPASTCCA